MQEVASTKAACKLSEAIAEHEDIGWRLFYFAFRGYSISNDLDIGIFVYKWANSLIKYE